MNYIQKMRQHVGHDCLIVIGSGVIVEQDEKILLEQRADNGLWGIPGGLIEIGEKVKDAAIREVTEETGLIPREITLFGIYSGEDYMVTYPNGDEVYSVTIVFYTKHYDGELTISKESKKLRFVSREEIMNIEINPPHKAFVSDWVNGNNEINIY
ncbi:NUDIX hydrolase [Macrococcus capreoli]|uniref:NUDIX hydrolase n=1 Tax=Macrococcus capreoli TaxID=2982690 RepID=UPI0021D5A136|nr:NUDIX domain-containing protein [Macrococcus sp. TMW 2.2395]MCU7558004.1 NUDIX domain-containing protein [Macrococcus sp. TMW 2.2395]